MSDNRESKIHTARIQLRMTPEQAERLRVLAANDDRTPSQYLRRLIDHEFEKMLDSTPGK